MRYLHAIGREQSGTDLGRRRVSKAEEHSKHHDRACPFTIWGVLLIFLFWVVVLFNFRASLSLFTGFTHWLARLIQDITSTPSMN
jgi:hypothetical protein